MKSDSNINISASLNQNIFQRIDSIDWERVSNELNAEGYSFLKSLIMPEECSELMSLYDRDDIFRSRVVMSRHGFGRGEYKYFNYPLPDLIQNLRADIYPKLVPVANRWNQAIGKGAEYPVTHKDYINRCRETGQIKPTPLILRYETDDYNCLHQDLYGENIFPLQVAIFLSEPGRDYTGGEFVLTEQRPRMQSRPIVITPHQGDAVVFAVNQRPVHGYKGYYRVNLKHGVSKIRSGERYTLGIIFHDAA